jgi:hypothetical protein
MGRGVGWLVFIRDDAMGLWGGNVLSLSLFRRPTVVARTIKVPLPFLREIKNSQRGTYKEKKIQVHGSCLGLAVV